MKVCIGDKLQGTPYMVKDETCEYCMIGKGEEKF